jgi:hypothetical protein
MTPVSEVKDLQKGPYLIILKDFPEGVVFAHYDPEFDFVEIPQMDDDLGEFSNITYQLSEILFISPMPSTPKTFGI